MGCKVTNFLIIFIIFSFIILIRYVFYKSPNSEKMNTKTNFLSKIIHISFVSVYFSYTFVHKFYLNVQYEKVFFCKPSFMAFSFTALRGWYFDQYKSTCSFSSNDFPWCFYWHWWSLYESGRCFFFTSFLFVPFRRWKLTSALRNLPAAQRQFYPVWTLETQQCP